jgi:hypothetical protein
MSVIADYTLLQTHGITNVEGVLASVTTWSHTDVATEQAVDKFFEDPSAVFPSGYFALPPVDFRRTHHPLVVEFQDKKGNKVKLKIWENHWANAQNKEVVKTCLKSVGNRYS